MEDTADVRETEREKKPEAAKYFEDRIRATEHQDKQGGQEEDLHTDGRKLALTAAGVLDGKQGENITVIDVSEASAFADYLVIATAGSFRQSESLADDVEEKLAGLGLEPLGIEGRGQTGWILLDYNSVVINILTQDMRDKYRLEDIWGDCERLDFGRNGE